ncbi:MAG: zinc ribbon domain-containing protein [Anaerolineales bacterium]|nr:zinc ribbon domain-containing protein [Anaerolineales bacterium]
MPIYEYECTTCGERFDKLIRSLSRMPAEIICPACQSSETRRLISAPAVRTGEGGGESEAAMDSSPARPAVFGRKELNEALAKKKELREASS